MSKTFAPLFIVLLTAASLLLQAQNTHPVKAAVYLADKGEKDREFKQAAPQLSALAIAKRIQRNVGFDAYDLPVWPGYVEQMKVAGMHVLGTSRWLNCVLVEAPGGSLEALNGLPGVKRVRPLMEYPANIDKFAQEQLLPAPTPAKRKSSLSGNIYDYGIATDQITQLNGQVLHNQGFSGQGMIIAVLDAGFNSADLMPCFDSLFMNNQILGTKDFVDGGDVYRNTLSTHGSNVLSCMGAYLSGGMVGTAPKASFYLFRTEDTQSETEIEEYNWVMGAERADSLGADLINSSLGYTVLDPPSTHHTYSEMDGNTTVVTIGADRAAQKGILVVNSAGNEGANFWKYIGAPADGDSVFSIGAVDDQGIRAFFSSQGPTYDGRIKPNVCARGFSAALCDPNWGLTYGNGTSFSSPITCGACCCLWQAFPSKNNMQIMEVIQQSGSQAAQVDTLMGYGIPDFANALTILSVQEPHKLTYAKCFPNPFTDDLFVDCSNLPSTEAEYCLYDALGRRVKSGRVGANSSILALPLGDGLDPGIFTLTLRVGQQLNTYRVCHK